MAKSIPDEVSRRSRRRPFSIRRWLSLRVCVALCVTAACVAAAGVLAARQVASQRLGDQAATAKSVFDHTLAQRSHREGGTAARRRAERLAAAQTTAATGVSVRVNGAGRPGGRTYQYDLRRGGRLDITVSTAPLADATRRALIIEAGVGVGIVLLVLSLLALSVDRTLIGPLTRFAGRLSRAAAGQDPGAGERLPVELEHAAESLDGLVARLADQRARLKDAVASDPVTGVINSRQFHELLGVELKRAEREQASMSLVMIDIDGFGAINDAHGHSYGDELLRRVAGKLRQTLRATDMLARLGADDFAVILPGADGELAVTVAERARRAVGSAWGDENRVSCSAGVASYPDDARDAGTLLKFAGGAVRLAKENGRGQTRCYDVDQVVLPSDEDERAEIEALLEREQPLVTFFQPLVSLSTGRVLGYEALSRFPEPPGRGPEAWFAQAARCGLGPRLEAIALRAALEAPGRPLGTFLSLNVSPTTLVSPEVRDVLPDDLTGITIEITEHELADDLDALEDELSALRMRGARIAVDDAGAGYSGLQQVMRIQPDVIKLDRSLIMNVHEDPAKEALIDSFVRFARRTGASVCAEGIEQVEELKLLADLDVTYGQGYVLARPAPGWATVSNSVSESLLRSSLRSQGDVSGNDELSESGDQRLELVSARLSKIHAIDELAEVFDLVADEIGADAVCLSRWVREVSAVETIADTSGQDVGARFNLSSYPSTAHVLGTGDAIQVLLSDPAAELGELALLGRLGYASLLMVPVVCQDERIGLLEAYSRVERPWTRTEINRARIISYQLGAVLGGLSRNGANGNGAAEPLLEPRDERDGDALVTP